MEDSPEVIERATSMGWLPQEQFRGDPDNWKPAADFVKMADTSLPHLKGTLKVMEDTIAEQKRTMEAMREDFGQFVQMSRSAEERAEKRAYEKAMGDLKREQLAAKEAGDFEKFAAATEAIDEKLAEGIPVAADGAGAKTPAQLHADWLRAGEADAQAWKAENKKWMEEEPDMFAYARQMEDFLMAKHELRKSRGEILNEMAKLVKKKFPSYFGNPARDAGSPVEAGTGGNKPSSSNGKSFQDLPAEAQKQAIKWCGKDGKGKTGTIEDLTFADFLASYKW